MAYRVDSYSTVRSVSRTPQGGISTKGYLTRTGILEYRGDNGEVRREYRPAEEVFHKDSMASLVSSTVTVDHHGMITTENWRDHSVGHVGEAPSRKGDYVQASLYVQDQKAVERLLANEGPDKLVEISCGYTCTYDPTPGSYQGQKYDGIQRDNRYNHVALGPKGWGRAGAEVRIREDGGKSDLGYCVSAGPLDHPLEDSYSMEYEKLYKESQARVDSLVAEVATLKARHSRLVRIPSRVSATLLPLRRLSSARTRASR